MFNKKMVLAIISVVILLLGIIKFFVNSFDEYYSQYGVYGTIGESKKAGAFIKEVRFEPKEIMVDGKAIRIKEAWIEEQLQKKYRFLFFSYKKHLGEYYLCFTLEDTGLRDKLREYFFARSNSGASFAVNSGQGSYVYNDILESTKPGVVNVSIVRESMWKKWKDKRNKQIKFIIP